MKKIISSIMAVLMLCALCVPAFAEDTAKEVKPTPIGDGNYEIFIKSSENCIIKKD